MRLVVRKNKTDSEVYLENTKSLLKKYGYSEDQIDLCLKKLYWTLRIEVLEERMNEMRAASMDTKAIKTDLVVVKSCHGSEFWDSEKKEWRAQFAYVSKRAQRPAKKPEDDSEKKPWLQYKNCKSKCNLPECKQCGYFWGDGHDKHPGQPTNWTIKT